MYQKLSVGCQRTWTHHRSGWSSVVKLLKDRLCTIRGVIFEGYVDGLMMRDTIIKEPWVGFVHNPIHMPSTAYEIWPKMMAVDKMLESTTWLNNKSSCVGLFTLSQECCSFLSDMTDLKVSKLFHPTEPGPLFSIDKYLRNDEKKLISIGQWLRDFSSISNAKTDLLKVVLKTEPEMSIPLNLKFIDRVTNSEYDELLTKNIVLLDLYAANANNTVIECMVRNTPLIARRHPSIVEYLGDDYPLFYDDTEEIEELSKLDRIIGCHKYLSEWHITQQLDLEFFFQDFINSDVYRSI